MKDRITADRLNCDEKMMTWNGMVAKTENKLQEKGIKKPNQDQVYKAIIESSQRSRQSFNKNLGVK